MNTREKNIIITVSVIFCIILCVVEIMFQFSAPQKNAGQDRVVMNLGTTDQQFIQALKAQGYIKNVYAFNFVLWYKHETGNIKPGAYLISKNMNAWQFANQVVNHPYQKWVVIPEGLRDEEIAEIVEQTLNWNDTQKNNFLSSSTEGHMFPDSYLLNVTDTGADVAKAMEDQFNEQTATLFSEARKNNIRNDTLITLASLVQREAANNQDMPLIAEVIWNRLLANMPLQIDSSIQYALGKSGDWWGSVTPSDYTINSPYNTYTHTGKPPAPICDPGIAAINAIINPAVGNYLYYLHDSSGQIHLANTYAEHQANIKKYLQNNE
jgi:UPF0755 protein